MLGNFSPKETSFKANLKDGREVELFLRPYSLADMSWNQEEFQTEQDRIDIASMKIDPLSKLIWHQLKEESKKIFMDFTFVKEDEDGNEIEVKPEGYQRLIDGFSDFKSLISGYAAFAETMEKNGFLPDTDKKKTMKR